MNMITQLMFSSATDTMLFTTISNKNSVTSMIHMRTNFWTTVKMFEKLYAHFYH